MGVWYRFWVNKRDEVDREVTDDASCFARSRHLEASLV